MKNLIILIAVLLTFAKADVEIVGSTACKIESISKGDVKKLFMLKKTVVDEEKIQVLDSSDKELYNEFVMIYLNKSLRKMKTYWVRMLFTGKKIPPKKFSSEELTTLNDTEGCHFSYVKSVTDMPKDWKILTIK